MPTTRTPTLEPTLRPTTLPSKSTSTPTSSPTFRTSVVLVVVDDMGFGDVGYSMQLNRLTGLNIAKTPNLDQMARSPNTWILNNMHSEAACSPTRVAILTARSPLRDCVMGEPMVGKTIYYEQASTVAQLAQRLGYDTFFTGKYPGDVQRLAQFPQRLGFTDWRTMQGGSTWDYTCGCRDYSSSNSLVQANCFLGHDQAVTTSLEHARDCVSKISPSGETNFPLRGQMDTDFLVQDFERWRLEKRQLDPTKPYFAEIAFKSVHIPFVASPALRSACAARQICNKLNPSSLEMDYGGCLSSVDTAVGRIREIVRAEPQGEDTILIFVSDNGPAPLTGMYPGAGNTGGLRGEKLTLFEGLLRVPALWEWPRQIKANTVTNSLMSIMDIPATLAQLLGPGDNVFPGAGTDGASFLPALLNNQPVFTRRNTLGVCSFIPAPGIAKKLVCDFLAFYDPSGQYKLIAKRASPYNSQGFPNIVLASSAVLYDLWAPRGEFVASPLTSKKLELIRLANLWLADLFTSFRTRCPTYY